MQEHVSDAIERDWERVLLFELLFDQLVESKDSSGLLGITAERANREEYRTALEKRDKLRAELSTLEHKYNIVKGNSANENGEFVKGTYVSIREATLAYREVFEKLGELQEHLNQYRKLTAIAASTSAKVREENERANGTFLEFTGDKLGKLVVIGDHESGSPEWHASRAEGIGGSDVGAIMRVDAEYASVNYRRVRLAKLGEEPDNASPMVNDEATAIGRGNAWEEALRQRCADENPDLKIAFCKTSWAAEGKYAYRRANFDGLILDENGTPDGVVEIKTGSDRSKWGSVSLGIWGVPAGYRKQILWYAALGELKRGKLVVLLDDWDYREYDFDMNDLLIQKEISEIFKATDEFWKKISKEITEKSEGVKSSTTRTRGFGKTLDFERIAQTLAAYSGAKKAKVKKRLISEVLKLEEKLGRELEAAENQALLVKLFAEYNPAMRGKSLYGIDIETSRASPRNGRIIESGIAILSSDEDPKIVYSALHGVPDSVKNGVGIGFEEVHGINISDLEGKPEFNDPEVQKILLEYLTSGVMVAHNSGFEDRFLIANLAGYAEARDADLVTILDTRPIATYLMPDSEDSSLNSFAEDNGVPYEGAHAAAADALMMMKALLNLQKTLYKRGKFTPKRVTKVSRRNAIKAAVAAEAAR